MQVKDFKELYIEELRDIYSAENQLVEALPKIANAATSQSLVSALRKNLSQTRRHVDRLERIFRDLEEEPAGHACETIQGFIRDNAEVIDHVEEGPLCDSALIIGCQKIEHYEIAGYGSLKVFAQLMGYERHVGFLNETLEEEMDADRDLSGLAQEIYGMGVPPSPNEKDRPLMVIVETTVGYMPTSASERLKYFR